MTACGGNLIGCEIRRNKQCPLCGLASIEAAGQQRYVDRSSAERSEAEDGQSLDCRPKPALPRSGAARGDQSNARTEKTPKDVKLLEEE